MKKTDTMNFSEMVNKQLPINDFLETVNKQLLISNFFLTTAKGQE